MNVRQVTVGVPDDKLSFEDACALVEEMLAAGNFRTKEPSYYPVVWKNVHRFSVLWLPPRSIGIYDRSQETEILQDLSDRGFRIVKA